MNEKPLISLMITEDLVKEMHWNAGQFIKDLSKLIKGGGGGQAFFATAGGSDVKGLTLIKEKTKSIKLMITIEITSFFVISVPDSIINLSIIF